MAGSVGRRGWGAGGLGVLGATLMLLLGAQTVLAATADCANNKSALLDGGYQVRVTFAGYSGGLPSFGATRSPGSSGVSTVNFSTRCGENADCSTTMLIGQSGGVSFDNDTGLLGPDPGHPLVKKGDSFSSTFIPGGFGGPNLPPCPPPRITYQLTLQVLQASLRSGHYEATLFQGTETVPQGWVCNGNVGVISAVANYVLLGVPAGTSFPDSGNLPCSSGGPLPGAVQGDLIGLSGGAGGIHPSSFSAALPTPSQAFSSATTTVLNVIITMGLVLFVTFPAQLFNKTLEENYDEIREVMSRRFGWVARMRRSLQRESSPRSRLIVFSVVVLVGALLGSLNDPSFGSGGSSWLTYLGVVSAMLVGLLAGTEAARLYRRARREDASGHLHALPAGLLVAGVCVILSRSTHFQPGYLYGVIFGVAFTKKLTGAVEGLAVIVAATTSIAVAVLAWMLWLPVHGHGNAGLVLVGDVLAPLVVGGFVGTVIVLMPLRFLAGGTLFGWNRGVWAGTFGLALFGLVQLLLHPGQSPVNAGKAPLVTAIVLFVCFGALSVAFNLYFERRKKRRTPAPAPGPA